MTNNYSMTWKLLEHVNRKGITQIEVVRHNLTKEKADRLLKVYSHGQDVSTFFIQMEED